MQPVLHRDPEPPDRQRPATVDAEEHETAARPGPGAGDRSSNVKGGATAEHAVFSPRTEDIQSSERAAAIAGAGALATAAGYASSASGARLALKTPPIARSTATSSSPDSLPAVSTHARLDQPDLQPPPPTTSASQSSSITPSPPSHRSMRRVPRLSPNSRNERPAPSTLAGRDYFSSQSSTATASRTQRRDGSLPPSTSRLARSSSLNSSAPSPRDQPGPSRASRHLDPGDHWLSEDEAGEVTFDFDRLRRSRRQRPGRTDDVQRGPGPDRKLPMPSGLAINQPTLPEYQRTMATKSGQPARSAPTTPPVEQIGPTIAVVLPKLAALLTCPSCHRIVSNPTTIACGHSHCLVCPIPPRDPYATPPVEKAATEFTFSIPAPQHVTPALTGSPQSSALSTPAHATQLDSNQLYRTLSSASTASSISSRRSSIIEPPPMVCPVPTCAFPHSQLVMRHPPLKVDYTLRKLVELVERLAGPAILADLVKSQQAASYARVDGHLTPMFSDVRLGSEAPAEPAPVQRHGSGSSGGGEDEPVTEEDSKRAHKAGADYRHSKKRRETRSPSPAPVTNAPTYADVPTSFFAQLQNECECQICFQLFHEPVTAPCGHSYCRNCLARSYDHSDKCPLCRADLPPLSYFRWQRPNHTLTAVIDTALPELAAERAAAVKQEELALLEHVPIFVCTTAWPGIKSYLHIFEPRYRLMIRRALETPDKSFGMVLPLSNAGPDAVNEFGTMLRITSCQMLEDGRLILETIGTYRFRLVERGVVDGYNVGKIERVDDISPEQEAALERAAVERSQQADDEDASWVDPTPMATGARPPMTGNQELTTQQLMQICLDFIRTLRAGSAPWVIERLNRTVGVMPTNAHDFSWFAAEIFPVEDHVKVTLLQITSVRERLRLIVFWIEQIRSSWWYSRGCTIT